MRYASMREQFDALLVKQENGCWYLKLEPKSNGYCSFGSKYMKQYVHIYAYKTFIGPIPSNAEIHHKCECKKCCNPEHLKAVTKIEHQKAHTNSFYSIETAKTKCPYGHEYVSANTYVDKKGKRSCQTCRDSRNRSKLPSKNLNDSERKPFKFPTILHV